MMTTVRKALGCSILFGVMSCAVATGGCATNSVEEQSESSSEELTVAGSTLSAAQAKWVSHVETNVVSRLPGTQAERARRAAIVVWWAMKEGVLDVQPNPWRHNLCTQNGHDVQIGDLGTCSGAPAWQTGLSGIQVLNVSDSQVSQMTSTIYPDATTTEVLTKIVTDAGIDPASSTGQQIIASTGRLRASWLLRDPAIGIALQWPFADDCVSGGPSWCYGSWAEAQKYASSLSRIKQVVTALEQRFMVAMTGDACAAGSVGNGDYCSKSLDPNSTETDLYTCVNRKTTKKVACANGCTMKPAGQNDVCAAAPAPPDPCAKATLGDGAYCAVSLDASATTSNELFKCVNKKTSSKQACEFGCKAMAPGQNDVCAKDPNAPATTVPSVTINAGGMYFTAASVRQPINDGIAYMLDRIATLTGTTGTISPIRINYTVSSNTYCSGFAGWDYTDIACPWNYPVNGDNQNYVMNLTMHEIGHILAAQLFGSPSSSARDTCENEGIASWIAGKFWMNTFPANPASSFKAAALDDVARGRAWLSMSNCVSASDAWYTVYASFFEYLEKNVPGGVKLVASGQRSQWDYVTAWKTWMQN